MSDSGDVPPILGVSLKLYLSVADTRAWLDGLARLSRERRWADHLEVFVCPELVMLQAAVQSLAGSGLGVGAQDVFWVDRGPYTGEVSPASVAELGGRYAEIGHAERRRLFGETDGDVGLKVTAARRHGLTPVVCVGEPERGAAADAIAICAPQVAAALGGDEAVGGPLIFAYEPVWAIGADAPAPPSHVRTVIGGLRELARARAGTRWIYGGSVERGLYGELADVVDGLFVGRAAHDLANLATIADEVVIGTGDR
jgi:triosephosphate isomerase